MQSGGTLRRPSNSAYDEQNYQQKHQSKNVNCTGSSNGAAIWLATTSAEQLKNKYQDQNKNCNEVTESENNHLDIADPPLEYSELPRKQNVEVRVLDGIFQTEHSEKLFSGACSSSCT